jgi:SecDF, P1 head subdomain
MGPVRHLRNLAPLAVVATLGAVLLSACGSGSSSSGASAGPGDQLQVRPVSARHDPGLSLGPQVPKDVAALLAKQTCPTDPKVVDAGVLECDARGSVFLLKDPIITGGVQSATATHIGNQKLWYVKVDLTPDAAAKMKAATASASGQEVAYSLGGKVLTTIPVDSQFDPNHLVVLGDYDEAQAKALATQLAQN